MNAKQIASNLADKSSGWSTKPNTGGKSKVWREKFSLVIDSNNKQTSFVQCIKCKSVLTYDQNSGTSHLHRHHCSISSSGCLPKIDGFVTKIHSQNPVSSQLRKSFVQHSVSFCCKDIRPFDTIGGAGFLEIAQQLVNAGAQYGKVDVTSLLPHATTVSRHVKSAAVELKQTVKVELKEALKVGGGITTDMWSDDVTHNSFTSITVHYILPDFVLKNRVLATVLFDPEQKKTGDNLHNEICRILKTFDIDPVVLSGLCFVSDRGSNIIKALKSYERISCIQHGIHNAVKALLDEKNLEEYPEVYETLESCKSLVQYFKKSGLNSRLDKTLKQSVDVRWNSTLRMLKSVVNQYEKIQKILVERNDSSRIENISIPLIETLIEVLEFPKEVSDQLEASATCTIHLVVPLLCHLTSQLSPSDTDNQLKSYLKGSLLKFLNDKIYCHSLHDLAVVFNPKMKSLKIFSQGKRDNIIAEVRRMMAALQVDVGHSMIAEPRTKKAKLSSASTINKYEDTSSSEDEEETDEMTRYLSLKLAKDECNSILDWWKINSARFPNLSLLARRILSVPASSAASERNFSIAGRVFDKRRASLKPSSIDNILFMHSNMQ